MTTMLRHCGHVNSEGGIDPGELVGLYGPASVLQRIRPFLHMVRPAIVSESIPLERPSRRSQPMLSNVRFHTARLEIRQVTPADRNDLVSLEANPEVMLYLNGGRPVPEEGLTDSDFLTPRGTEAEVLVAHETATGRFVGWFCIFDEGVHKGLHTAELGYRLSRWAWGQGFATEGAKALSEAAFGQWGFDCVRAQTMTVNFGSRRVLEKAGFQFVDTVYPDFPDPVPGQESGRSDL
jgi:RimJ/RimL family protein N-acetyltransferase